MNPARFPNRGRRRWPTTAALAWCIAIAIPVAAYAHAGHYTDVAWRACDDHALGDPCSFDNGHALYRGTCRSIGGGLHCVRNQPLAPSQSASTSSTNRPWVAIAGAGLLLAIGGVAAVARRRVRGRDLFGPVRIDIRTGA